MKLLIVTLCVFAVLIPSALSIKCYVCAKADGNCKENKIDCSSPADTCAKVKTGDAVGKTCVTSSQCKLLKDGCEASGKCEAYCCDSDGCNASVSLKPVTFMTLLAMAVTVAKYLM